jgi:hypothetical protein
MNVVAKLEDIRLVLRDELGDPIIENGGVLRSCRCGANCGDDCENRDKSRKRAWHDGPPRGFVRSLGKLRYLSNGADASLHRAPGTY